MLILTHNHQKWNFNMMECDQPCEKNVWISRADSDKWLKKTKAVQKENHLLDNYYRPHRQLYRPLNGETYCQWGHYYTYVSYSLLPACTEACISSMVCVGDATMVVEYNLCPVKSHAYYMEERSSKDVSQRNMATPSIILRVRFGMCGRALSGWIIVKLPAMAQGLSALLKLIYRPSCPVVGVFELHDRTGL